MSSTRARVKQTTRSHSRVPSRGIKYTALQFAVRRRTFILDMIAEQELISNRRRADMVNEMMGHNDEASRINARVLQALVEESTHMVSVLRGERAEIEEHIAMIAVKNEVKPEFSRPASAEHIRRTALEMRAALFKVGDYVVYQGDQGDTVRRGLITSIDGVMATVGPRILIEGVEREHVFEARVDEIEWTEWPDQNAQLSS